MGPDLELVRTAVGEAALTWEPLDTGGYTRSRAWRVETGDGPVFVKQADDEDSLYMLRRESAVYRGVAGSFLPSFVGFADSGTRAVLAVELLEGASWPPPYPEDVRPLFDALELVAAATPPPAAEPRRLPARLASRAIRPQRRSLRPRTARRLARRR